MPSLRGTIGERDLVGMAIQQFPEGGIHGMERIGLLGGGLIAAPDGLALCVLDDGVEHRSRHQATTRVVEMDHAPACRQGRFTPRSEGARTGHIDVGDGH